MLAATAAINLVPTIALILLWAHFPRLGGILLFLPLAIGLVIGGSEHFVTPGPLNIFYMAATPWALPFGVTAVLLLVLEVWGCWIAVQAFRGGPLSKNGARAESAGAPHPPIRGDEGFFNRFLETAQ